MNIWLKILGVSHIRWQCLSNNISQILEFGFVVWEFISSIYKSDWDKLITNDKDMAFW